MVATRRACGEGYKVRRHSVQRRRFPVPPNCTPAQFPALRWDVSDDARRWLEAIQQQTDDAIAAGEDATRRPRRRVLSRVEARRKLKGARLAIAALLNAAVRGLDAGDENASR